MAIKWENFDLLGGPAISRDFRVFIAYKPKPVMTGKSGAVIYKVQSRKDVTDKFEALIGAYFEVLEKQGKAMAFNNGVVVLTLGTIEDKLKKIRELAEEIIDKEYSDADEEVAEEIIDLVDEILKLKERDGRG